MPEPIHLYRPHQTSAEALEAIFVGREGILKDVLEQLGRWERGGSRQHYLFIGPRGIGKTHLLRLVEHRIRKRRDLARKWRVVAIAEDNYSITGIADLLLEALRILTEQTCDPQLQAVYAALQYDDNHARLVDLSLDAFRRFHAATGAAILLMVENADRMFERQMRAGPDLHLLRKVLTEEEWLLLFCSSPTYLNAVAEPEQPFFEFFRVQVLAQLTADEQENMLRKLAALEKNEAFEQYLEKYRARLLALYHFTGGNPRLSILFYRLVTGRAISELQSELDLLLDALTPFYQDRMRDLSDHGGKLLETMALMPEGCTPTELAREARMPPKTVRSLMTRLERAGYLRREQRRQKRTLYVIPERLFRIWHQMNHSRAVRGRMQYLLEFFASWYATREERDRVWDDLLGEFRQGVAAGDDEHVADLAEYMEYVAEISKGAEQYVRKFDVLRSTGRMSGVDSIREQLAALDAQHSKDAGYFLYKGCFLADELGSHESALEAFQRAAALHSDDTRVLFDQAVALDRLGNWAKAERTYGRVAAALSDSMDYESTPQVRESLARVVSLSRNRWTVWVASFLLQRLFPTECRDHLKAVLDSPKTAPWRRRYCINALGFRRCAEDVPILLPHLTDTESDVRGSAATALGRIGSEEGVAPLIRCLEDERSDVRGSAATALGGIGAEQAVAPLIRCLQDEANNVRGSAATALGRIGSEEGVAPLIRCLEDDVDPMNRGSAATALGQIGTEQAVAPLIRCLEADDDAVVRGSAATALGRIGAEQAVAPLIRCLEDEGNNVRGSAATALGRIGAEEAVAPLIRCLEDERSDVRGSAATALGRIGAEQAVAPLIRCLEDEGNNVRGSAATALGRIGAEQAVAPLIRCLEADHDAVVRGSAAKALGRIGAKEAVDPLVRCLKDEATRVRWNATTALGRIALDAPMPELPHVIGDLLTESAALSRHRRVAVVEGFLRSCFFSEKWELLREMIETVRARLADADLLCAPYVSALAYLESDREPAVLERQQPEMREAVQLLVEALDRGRGGEDEQDRRPGRRPRTADAR